MFSRGYGGWAFYCNYHPEDATYLPTADNTYFKTYQAVISANLDLSPSPQDRSSAFVIVACDEDTFIQEDDRITGLSFEATTRWTPVSKLQSVFSGTVQQSTTGDGNGTIRWRIQPH